MATSKQVITANAMRLAAEQYNDATMFVAIMQTNALSDYRINDPVITTTLAPVAKGGTFMIFEPVDGIKIGDAVCCDGLKEFAVVTNVEQTRTIAASSFCTCPTHFRNDRILPPSGDRLTTIVTIAPGLDQVLMTGSKVTFANTHLDTMIFPPYAPTAKGVVS